jgi:hypothetical protein
MAPKKRSTSATAIVASSKKTKTNDVAPAVSAASESPAVPAATASAIIQQDAAPAIPDATAVSTSERHASPAVPAVTVSPAVPAATVLPAVPAAHASDLVAVTVATSAAADIDATGMAAATGVIGAVVLDDDDGDEGGAMGGDGESDSESTFPTQEFEAAYNASQSLTGLPCEYSSVQCSAVIQLAAPHDSALHFGVLCICTVQYCCVLGCLAAIWNVRCMARLLYSTYWSLASFILCALLCEYLLLILGEVMQ